MILKKLKQKLFISIVELDNEKLQKEEMEKIILIDVPLKFILN